MDRAPLPDLNSLGREALLALIRAQEEEFAAQDAEIQRKRQTKRMDEVFAAQAAGVRSATR